LQETKPAEKHWFTAALDSCFGTVTSISYAVFLRVFTAPMCVPWNRNYGKSKAQRREQTAASPKRRPEDVYCLQQGLLQDYREILSGWECGFQTPKLRLQDLSDKLMNRLLDQDRSYADKHYNHKPQNYLSFFLHARTVSEENCQELFRQTVSFYADALEKVFRNTGADTEARLEDMKKAYLASLSGQNPREPEGDYISITGKMGWYLAALLLLNAVTEKLSRETNDLAELLLNVTLLEEGRTVSVPTLNRMSLTRNQLLLLLGAALRAPLNMAEIEELYGLFRQIHQLSEGQLDMEFSLLLDHFLQAMNEFRQRRSGELAASWDNKIILDELGKVRDIYIVCQSWPH